MNTPFHMIIVGMTASGKTHYLLDMLEREYKGHFDHIFIVCPTLKDNETYQNWKYLNDPDVFELACAHNEVEKFLQDIVHFAANTNSLIILDDCAACKYGVPSPPKFNVATQLLILPHNIQHCVTTFNNA